MVLTSEQQINIKYEYDLRTEKFEIWKKTYRGLDLMKTLMEWH